MTTPRSGVPATVMPLPRRNSSIPSSRNSRSGLRGGATRACIEPEGLIVDITADQFADVDEPVIVTTVSTWHDTFSPMHPRPAGLGPFHSLIDDDLRQDYATLKGRAATYLLRDVDDTKPSGASS
jgi:hypothetical protein